MRKDAHVKASLAAKFLPKNCLSRLNAANSLMA